MSSCRTVTDSSQSSPAPLQRYPPSFPPSSPSCVLASSSKCCLNPQTEADTTPSPNFPLNSRSPSRLNALVQRHTRPTYDSTLTPRSSPVRALAAAVAHHADPADLSQATPPAKKRTRHNNPILATSLPTTYTPASSSTGLPLVSPHRSVIFQTAHRQSLDPTELASFSPGLAPARGCLIATSRGRLPRAAPCTPP